MIHDFIISLNFTQCIDDSCVYIKTSSNYSIIYIGLYVDDIILAGNNFNDIKFIKNKISSRFSCKDMGEIDQYLGIQIIRDSYTKSLTISMKQYIDRMLNTFGMSNCNIRQSPIEYRFIPSYDM